MGEEGPTRFGIHTNSNVAGAVAGDHWRIPQATARCPQAAELRAVLLTARTPQQPHAIDKYFWGKGSFRSDSFSTKKTWETFRHRDDGKYWATSVWFRWGIPKHSFLTWIITLDRLLLKTRLLKWGISSNAACCICDSHEEDRDHLFLHCDFALQAWKWLDTKLNSSCCFQTWSSLLVWLTAGGSRAQKLLRICSAQAVLYSIWMERNARYHSSGSSTPEATILKVDKSVRLSTLATLGKRHYQRLLSMWFRFT